MKHITLITVLLFSSFLTGQNLLHPARLAIDDSLGLAIFQVVGLDSLPSVVAFDGDEQTYKVISNDPTRTKNAYSLVNDNSKEYITYTSSLPLIQIDAPQGIVDEPKRLAQIKYSDIDTTFTAFVGIELRGSSSLSFSKKNYDLNFYKDSITKENADVRLAGMRKDDDWILDGLFNEPLRMRSYLSFNLWHEIHQPYYLDREPKAKSGVQGTHADVFVNGKYQGVFLLQEQVDRKLTRIRKIKNDVIHGELFQGSSYAGAVTFDTLPEKKNYLPSWGGYTIKYPVPTDAYWDSVYAFTDFAIHSSDDAFAKAIADKFHMDNAIDYFLFINALRAPDNLGKNLFLIRYDTNEPYFYAPWDLDGSFGTIFSGKRISTNNDFLQNGLLKRLIATNADDFVFKFQKRWKELRAGVLASKAILEKQEEAYSKLQNEGVYERESLIWKAFNYDKEGLEYMQQWTLQRLLFLDTYIANMNRY